VKGSKSEAFLVQVHPRVAAILIGGGGKPLRELEEATGKVFHFHGTEGSPLDTFAITEEATRDEIEHRALPFKKGEEVLIRIEEPHMYNIDDAIAKIDGYVISISGGAPFVGDKKLVRIDEVKRTAAYASLLDQPESNGDAKEPERPARRRRKPAPANGRGEREKAAAVTEEEPDEVLDEESATEGANGAPEGDEEQVQSNGSKSKRRRGRRGGRRRSRARPREGSETKT
jgi:ribonuclease G